MDGHKLRDKAQRISWEGSAGASPYHGAPVGRRSSGATSLYLCPSIIRVSGRKMSGALLEPQTWAQPPGLPHIIAVLLPEKFAHHPLLARRADKIQHGKCR